MHELFLSKTNQIIVLINTIITIVDEKKRKTQWNWARNVNWSQRFWEIDSNRLQYCINIDYIQIKSKYQTINASHMKPKYTMRETYFNYIFTLFLLIQTHQTRSIRFKLSNNVTSFTHFPLIVFAWKCIRLVN